MQFFLLCCILHSGWQYTLRNRTLGIIIIVRSALQTKGFAICVRTCFYHRYVSFSINELTASYSYWYILVCFSIFNDVWLFSVPIGMKNIYDKSPAGHGSVENTCLPYHQKCGWAAAPKNDLPLFVLSVGLEGTNKYLLAHIYSFFSRLKIPMADRNILIF